MKNFLQILGLFLLFEVPYCKNNTNDYFNLFLRDNKKADVRWFVTFWHFCWNIEEKLIVPIGITFQ